MNYYEELGIRIDAECEDIRKAHRRLVKLMHPDHQGDPHMKLLAETQMRRLKIIVSTLLNADQRGEYDKALRGRHEAGPVPLNAHRGVPWSQVGSAAAGILSVGGIWFFAGHLGISMVKPSYIPPQQTVVISRPSSTPGNAARSSDLPNTSQARGGITAPKESSGFAAAPSQEIESAKAGDSARGLNVPAGPALTNRAVPKPQSAEYATFSQAIPIRSAPDHVAQDRANAPGESTEVKVEHRRLFRLPNGIILAPQVSQHVLVTPPPPALAASSHVETESPTLSPVFSTPIQKADIPKPDSPAVSKSLANPDNAAVSNAALGDETSTRDVLYSTLEGEWVYSPKEPEKRKLGFYPPQFINFKLSQQQQGGMHGQYTARYEVSGINNPVSPDVSFQVVTTGKDSRKFIWRSSNGSRGSFVIRPLDNRTIRIEWRTTVALGSPVLTSGIATLVRRR